MTLARGSKAQHYRWRALATQFLRALFLSAPKRVQNNAGQLDRLSFRLTEGQGLCLQFTTLHSCLRGVWYSARQRVPPLDVVKAVDHQVLCCSGGAQVLRSKANQPSSCQAPKVCSKGGLPGSLLDDVPLLRFSCKLLSSLSVSTTEEEYGEVGPKTLLGSPLFLQGKQPCGWPGEPVSGPPRLRILARRL